MHMDLYPRKEKLKNNAEEIGTMRLSIPKILNCSSKVAKQAIVK